jgi:arginine repressor
MVYTINQYKVSVNETKAHKVLILTACCSLIHSILDYLDLKKMLVTVHGTDTLISCIHSVKNTNLCFVVFLSNMLPLIPKQIL